MRFSFLRVADDFTLEYIDNSDIGAHRYHGDMRYTKRKTIHVTERAQRALPIFRNAVRNGRAQPSTGDSDRIPFIVWVTSVLSLERATNPNQLSSFAIKKLLGLAMIMPTYVQH